MGGRVKNEGAIKRSSKTIDIVSYALKLSVNGVMSVCSPLQVIGHICKLNADGQCDRVE